MQNELQGSLPGFASGEKKVAKRLYSLEDLKALSKRGDQEMKQNGVDAAQFLPHGLNIS